MPFVPALVSITFRQLPPEQVLAAARAAGLRAIEWGGDVHCPHGDVARAREVARLTAAAGMAVCAYGSYYRLGAEPAAGPSFGEVVASAEALGAPRIRVWVGTAGSADTTPAQRQRIIDDARRCADRAAARGIRVVSEWHGGTLTDTAESGRSFLEAVAHPAFATVWQPSVGLDADASLAEFDAVAPWIEHLHVFHWRERERRPLAEGAERWRRYVARAAQLDRPLSAALEFVLGDDPAQLARDGATLNALLAEHP
jgi:sugar phosphate isomerase/epimerase